MTDKKKEINRLINYLKEGGGIGRMPNSSIELIIEALTDKINPDVVKVTRCKDCIRRHTPTCPKAIFLDSGECYSRSYREDYCSCGVITLQ